MVRDKSPEPNPWMESLIRAAAESELARAAASVRADGGQAFALGDSRVRPLFPEEVARLEGLGNTCDDWTRVRVAVTFDWRRVRQCHLQGDVVLGHFRRYVP